MRVHHRTSMRGKRFRLGAVIGVGLATLALGACSGGSDSSEKASASTTTTPSTPTACGTYSGRGCAPSSGRVDLAAPKFSNPTEITNPLHPTSRVPSAVMLGTVDDELFRVEITLLPQTRTIKWNGQRIEALQTQYLAYLDGAIHEVAIDVFAQADDGSVWYLGEDVFNYENGTIADVEGTWHAGREGPGAMIMPAKPKVGDVYRPENVIGVVFEEVEVKAVGRRVQGPSGPVEGAIVVDELHLDESHESKTFAPGYGEFVTGGGGDVEAVALAVPTDAAEGPVPAELEFLSTAAAGTLQSVLKGEWEGPAATITRINAVWKTLRAGELPPLVAERMDTALRRLTRSVAAKQPIRAAQAAIAVSDSALDLELRHRPPVEIDAERFDLRSRQLLVHAAAKDAAGVAGDVAVLEWIRDRIAPTSTPAERRRLDTGLRALRASAEAGRLAAAADHAARLSADVRRFSSVTINQQLTHNWHTSGTDTCNFSR